VRDVLRKAGEQLEKMGVGKKDDGVD